MDDLISRQAAIEAYGDWYVEEGTEEGFIGSVKQLLETLPSTKPEPQWIPCSEKLPSAQLGTNLAEVGTDCISRQAALVTVKDALMAWSYMPEWRDEKIIEAIAEMPSAQPEPKRGTWILDRSGAYCCSKCMEPCAGYVMMKPRDKFCKMCGSRNEVAE